ncbi:HAD-IIIC family phosphatase [Actinomadura madurae]|uniref:HAD-IIIC family phosphatase n=1 Tax=Actinomadura madurae TaxID=1993 RepID=UPI0020D1FA9F|nr:HAD-IIIC family phosphatase [Actinomadura madurae]MCP9972473.1 HAD-IIIC family phosphatase [Actinomadura madurae]MCP9984985.1 HAD-IIIC family phosphatase [Actinomadura madurae]MCQ0003456.1 HAD-IIIC family phosphatase [Actinomadura madurae]MCQ0021185.1 HAD-IIIC family phosphatase [Actinomadura madurae]
MPEPKATVKCLVWDLDNTLWQGTLLEDGEVRLPATVRELITTLDSRGILQSISSKNDHDLAWAKLEELGVAEYFVLPRIGWGAKSESVRQVAERLNFAHSAIAFIDDQPAERAEVGFHLPEVRLYAAEQLDTLLDLPEFSPETVTVDSRRRRQMYQAGFQRQAEQAAFSGPDEEFLRSLELVMHIGRAGSEQLSRVEELTLRTSQMNATGVHYSDAALRGLLADPGHEVLVATMSDRFGPHGAVGVLLLAVHPGAWHLKLLATSCRVVSFGAGAAILNWLIDEAARAGAHLVADFRPTDRNRMMEIAYRFAGLEEGACACLDTLPEAGAGDIRRLHLVPAPRAPHAAIRITAPDLAADHRATASGHVH